MTELLITLQLRKSGRVYATETINAGDVVGRTVREVTTIVGAEAKQMVLPLLQQGTERLKHESPI